MVILATLYMNYFIGNFTNQQFQKVTPLPKQNLLQKYDIQKEKKLSNHKLITL